MKQCKRIFSNRILLQARGSGFTLLELTVVLMIIAVIVGGAITLTSVALQNVAATTTKSKLKTLQESLFNYRIAYNRLPCPANSGYAMTEAYYGVEALYIGGYCSGGTPSADTVQAPGAEIGMVPVRTLGLPDDAAIDGWGRRINYAIPREYAAENGFDAIDADDTTERLIITNNDSNSALANTGAYVLVSHGKNGHGARAGSVGTLVNSAQTNSNELLNCKCDTSGVYDGGTATPAQFVQGDERLDPEIEANSFDDMVVFASRLDLRNPAKE